jgi:hypothetical protein
LKNLPPAERARLARSAKLLWKACRDVGEIWEVSLLDICVALKKLEKKK